MKKSSLILFLAALFGFGYGLYVLAKLRYAQGDVYPEYSSYRADPLGCKAWYESLERFGTTDRILRPLSRWAPGAHVTLFHLGATPGGVRFTGDEFKILEAFMREGGRLVVGMRPANSWEQINRRTTSFFGDGPVDPNAPSMVPITIRWDIEYGLMPLDQKDGVFQPAKALRASDDTLPEYLQVRTGLCFTNIDPAWRVVYQRSNDAAVVMERAFGKGSLVVCADAYPLSNEAMNADRQTELLAWIAGASDTFHFEETHLGVRSTPGIATLARKYGLHTFFLCLLALSGLFIWKNAVPFLPRLSVDAVTGGSSDRHVVGRDAAAGFVNLLQRNIPRRDLMKVCLEEWRAQFSHARKPAAERLKRMQALIDEENRRTPREQNPVRLYNEFARLLSRQPQRPNAPTNNEPTSQ